MAEKDPNAQSDFMIEKIKERPINKGKLVRRMLFTAAMAVLFGLVACVIFLSLEPILSRWMNPEKELPKIYFPEETEEMSPEEMLIESPQETVAPTNPPVVRGPEEMDPYAPELTEEQIRDILSQIQLDQINYRQMYNAMSEYARQMQKSMVTLTGITSRVDWFDNVNEMKNRASGIIIVNNTKELMILTDYSALENAQRLNVEFCNGAVTTAEFKRKDPSTGLAVVSVPVEALPEEFLKETIAVAKIGSSNYRDMVGMPIIALGSPMGSVNSAGFGIITSTSGQASDEDVNYKLLQTDIVGSPNADGALFDLYGQFIGFITQRYNERGMENVITAYGVSDLKKRMEKLSNNQPFAYFGIYGTSVALNVHEELKVPYGAYVKDVALDSPAMRAGIQKGDLIIQIDDRDVNNFPDYITILNNKTPDTTIRVKILRQTLNGYKEMQMDVQLGELK